MPDRSSSKSSVKKPTQHTPRKQVSKPSSTKIIPKQYDKPWPLAIAGVVGLIITYIVASRALNTGSYWEYLFTLIFVTISIRLLIRSLRSI
jgi:hypothetical protein